MNRTTVGLFVASVFLTLTLAACNSLMRIPAGQLAYPGATLTKSGESHGDSNEAMRLYSFVSPRPTAAQVLAWYTTRLASHGYAATGPAATGVAPTVATSSGVAQCFSGDGHEVCVSVGLAGKLPPGQARNDWPASLQTLRLGVFEMTVTIS